MTVSSLCLRRGTGNTIRSASSHPSFLHTTGFMTQGRAGAPPACEECLTRPERGVGLPAQGHPPAAANVAGSVLTVGRSADPWRGCTGRRLWAEAFRAASAKPPGRPRPRAEGGKDLSAQRPGRGGKARPYIFVRTALHMAGGSSGIPLPGAGDGSPFAGSYVHPGLA